jgi:hypothetical protein
MQNKITLDFKENPALRDALGHKRIGDTCTVKIKFQVDKVTEEGVEGTTQVIEPEGYKPGPGVNDGESKITPEGATEPVMVVVARRREKAASKGRGY